ncbi:MAG: RNA 3'-phosphate cyclase [candidate division Zixibacteria bacterium]|nr:RNA 3'-phosphate cyclase [candidate division Zixibacteria bacterium]
MKNSNNDIIRVDGSYGEGGGQILRTSLMLSTHLGKPLEIINIRKNRRTPGLMPQHLTAVRACQKICGAEVKGDSYRSEKLYFRPGKVRPGKYSFDIAAEKRSAGSAALVLQTMALPLFLVKGGSTIKVKGGTHVPWSPPATYLKQVFFPMLARLGLYSNIKILRWGFYPEGGGELLLQIKRSSQKIKCLDFSERGKLKRVTGLSAVANLPNSIAERQKKRALEMLREHGLRANIATKEARSRGKGTVLFLTAEYENVVAGFSRLGEKGKAAEIVAEEACQDMIDFNGKNVAIGHNLADQILPYLALTRNKFVLNVSNLTTHLLTNLWVISRFLDVQIDIKGPRDLPGIITVEPKS